MVEILGRPCALRTTSSGSKPCALAHCVQTRMTAGVESISTPSKSKSSAPHVISIIHPTIPKELLRFLCEFGIRHRSRFQLLVPLFSSRIRQLGKRLHFSLGVLRTAQMLKNLSTQVMNAGAVGIQLEGCVGLAQRFPIFFLALINTRELKVRAGKLRIEPQRLAKSFFRCLILLLKVVHLSQLIVVITDVRLNRDVFQKFRFSLI